MFSDVDLYIIITRIFAFLCYTLWVRVIGLTLIHGPIFHSNRDFAYDFHQAIFFFHILFNWSVLPSCSFLKLAVSVLLSCFISSCNYTIICKNFWLNWCFYIVLLNLFFLSPFADQEGD